MIGGHATSRHDQVSGYAGGMAELVAPPSDEHTRIRLAGEAIAVSGVKTAGVRRVSDGHLLWDPRPNSITGTMDQVNDVAVGVDRVFFLMAQSYLACCDFDGQELWTIKLTDPELNSSGDPILTSRIVYTIASDGSGVLCGGTQEDVSGTPFRLVLLHYYNSLGVRVAEHYLGGDYIYNLDHDGVYFYAHDYDPYPYGEALGGVLRHQQVITQTDFNGGGVGSLGRWAGGTEASAIGLTELPIFHFMVDGGDVVLTGHGGTLLAHSKAGAGVVFEHAFAGENVYGAASDGAGSYFVVTDARVVRLNSDGTESWSHASRDLFGGFGYTASKLGSRVIDGHLYVSSSSSTRARAFSLFKLQAADGALVWRV